MKILLITQDAPLYLAGFLDRLLPAISAAGHEVALTRLSPRFRRTWTAEIRDRLAFYGPWAFLQAAARIAAQKILSILPAGMRAGRPYSVANVLRRRAVAEWPTSSVNAPEYIDRIRREGIDLVVSIAAPEIFRTALLAAPRRGCINYHTALLPRHRGRQPLFWALLEGDREVGVSVHEMNEKIDDGPILRQVRVPVAPADTLHDLYLKTMAVGVPALLEAMDMVARRDPARIANPAAEATVHRFPTPETAREFRRKGRRFFG